LVQFRADIDDAGSRRIVRLSGSLEGEMSSELTRLCNESQKPVRLDLTDLLWMDAFGLRTLVTLQGRGAELVGASPFLALQLESALARASRE
jgi:anti-anti-sigma regulatory factor